jgi:hypothetical protein
MPGASTTTVPVQATPSTPVTPSTRATRSVPATPPPALIQLPRGGRRLLPDYRVVAYYGGPDGPALGVLGSADPDTIATRIEARAAQFGPYGRRIQPAMELITTVAQPCNRYLNCTEPIPDEAIQRYLDAAHRHKMLLILDFQPGRSEFLPQVQAVAKYLVDPSVQVALDPEWKMGPNQVPIEEIGSASAESVNAVAAYLSRLVAQNRLPDKLLIVHQFRLSMLPDRQNIVRMPGLETVLHADGFGGQGAKLETYRSLAFPVPPFHAGFKLFLTQDTNMMSPGQVMSLRPQPEIVTYQ